MNLPQILQEKERELKQRFYKKDTGPLVLVEDEVRELEDFLREYALEIVQAMEESVEIEKLSHTGMTHLIHTLDYVNGFNAYRAKIKERIKAFKGNLE